VAFAVLHLGAMLVARPLHTLPVGCWRLPEPQPAVRQARPAVGHIPPNSLHAVYTAISQCLRGATFGLPQYLVAILFPGLNAPIPVLASEKAMVAPGVAAAGRAGPADRRSGPRTQPRAGVWATR
jgi:hypothetical protein